MYLGFLHLKFGQLIIFAMHPITPILATNANTYQHMNTQTNILRAHNHHLPGVAMLISQASLVESVAAAKGPSLFGPK